ncbi:MAG: hypothetical protein KC925_02640 [Candidatus Doudnabacteria bacterium]|nr:hypothetical protein [Candidatus Doudnabacteria bacterium]
MKTEYTTACGCTIHLLPHTIEHLKAHPEASDLLGEAIGKVELPEGTFYLKSIDMGRVIGQSALVNATVVKPSETCTFAYRAGRDIPSRVVLDVEKPQTNLFTVIAGYDNESERWVLYTGFAGTSAAKEPTDPSLEGNNEDELDFWCRHALVHDESCTQPFESTWNEVIASAAE